MIKFYSLFPKTASLKTLNQLICKAKICKLLKNLAAFEDNHQTTESLFAIV